MLTWDYPWLLLLLPWPWLLRRWLPAHRAPTTGLRVPFLDRLARLTGQQPTEGAVIARSTWPREMMLGISWACIVTALARPVWLEAPSTRTLPTRDLLLAVDLSQSMQTKDMTDASGKSVDRLTAVQQVLDGFLARRQGDRVGLIVFGNAPFVQAPFTDDLAVCRELLAETQIGMAGPKTAFGDALGLAVTVFQRSQVRDRVLIALTDGNDTGSQVPPDRAAEVAKDQGIVVHTVAVGDPKAAGEEKLDTAALRRVADRTGGTYSFAGNRADLEEVYRRLDALPTRPVQTITHRPRRDLYYGPLGAALVLTLAYHGLALLVHRFPGAPARPARAKGMMGPAAHA